MNRSSFAFRVVVLLILAAMVMPLAMMAATVPVHDLMSGGALCAAGGIWLRPVIMEAESDLAPGAGGGGAGDAKLTIGQRLTAAASLIAKGEQGLADLHAKVTELTGQVAAKEAVISALEGQLAEANTKIATLEADAAQTAAALTTIEAEAAKLKGEAKTVESKTKEQMRALGFPATQLPAANDGVADVPTSRADLEVAIGKLKTEQERQDLLAKYRAAQGKN